MGTLQAQAMAIAPAQIHASELDDRPESEDQFRRGMEIDVLARTLWGEARNEGYDGMHAVANVVLNRVEEAVARGGQFWWGNDIIAVCHKPYQFSCWNSNDPNREKLMVVTRRDRRFQVALEIAERAVDGRLHDVTYRATHYHADYVSPNWAKNAKPLITIGRHIFYRV